MFQASDILDSDISTEMEDEPEIAESISQLAALCIDMKALRAKITLLAKEIELMTGEGSDTTAKEVELVKAQKILTMKGIQLEMASSEDELVDIKKESTSPFKYGGSTVDKKDVKVVSDAKVVVPSNLPQFRSKDLFDPEEFLELFERVMAAHNIMETRYVTLLGLCLDPTDNQWLNSRRLDKWSVVRDAFMCHFKDPNAELRWIQELEQLSVEQCGSVQRYNDSFTKRMVRLKWDATNHMAVHLYQKGLPWWMEVQLHGAISSCQFTTNDDLSVEVLSAMALRLAALSNTPSKG